MALRSKAMLVERCEMAGRPAGNQPDRTDVADLLRDGPSDVFRFLGWARRQVDWPLFPGSSD